MKKKYTHLYYFPFVTPVYPSSVDPYPLEGGGRTGGCHIYGAFPKPTLPKNLPISAVCLNMFRNYQSCTIFGRNISIESGMVPV